MQQSLFGPAPDEGRPIWVYHFGLPDRSGTFKYIHLIRSKHDPDETMARGSKARDPLHWKKTASVDEYKLAIMKLMSDGEPRTFNAICVELTKTTADVWLDKEPDKALWSLVEERKLVWACELGATFFLDANALEKP